MRNAPTSILPVILSLGLGLGIAGHLRADEFTWSPTTAGTHLWGTNVNWTPDTGLWPGTNAATPDVANLQVDIAGNQTIGVAKATGTAAAAKDVIATLTALKIGDLNGAEGMTFIKSGANSSRFHFVSPGVGNPFIEKRGDGNDTINVGSIRLFNHLDINFAAGTGSLTIACTLLEYGSGSLITVNGPGELLLTVNNDNTTYAGGTRLNQAALQIGRDRHVGGVPGALDEDNLVLANSSILRANGTVTLDANRGITLRGGTVEKLATVSDTDVFTINGPVSSDAGNPSTLEILGPGTIALLGANTYADETPVSGGRLYITSRHQGTSVFTVADGAGFGVVAVDAGASPIITSVTLGSGGDTTLDFDLATYADQLFEVASIGTLTINGQTTVNVTGENLAPGSVTLFQYGVLGGAGFSGLRLGRLPLGVIGHLEDSGSSVDLVVDAVVSSLSWSGNVNGDWDVGQTFNWNAGALSYLEYGPDTNRVGDFVRFDDFASGPTTINLTTNLRPAGLTVAGDFLSYTFEGAGQLDGNGSLVKSGTNTLVIKTPNTYAGGTTLSNGWIQVGHDTALGTGPITLAGGSVSSDSAAAREMANPIVINTASNFFFGDGMNAGPLTFSGPVDLTGSGNRNLTFDTDVTFSGVLTNGGIGDKNGLGTLTLRDMTANLISDFELRNGPVVFDHATISKSQGGMRIMCDQPASASVLTIQTGAAMLMEGPGQNVRVGSGSPAGDPTSTNILNVAGTVSWTTNATSYGQIQMGASCVMGQVNILPGGLIRPGMFAHQGNISEVNLDGGTLAGAYSTADYLGGLTAANVRSGGATVNTEGLLGEPLDLGIAQPLLDGGGGGGFIKTGAGTLTLTGANTYSGPTLINAGALLLGADHAAPGAVTVADGAVLGFLSPASGISVNLSSVTVGSASGASLDVRFTGPVSDRNSPAAIIGDLTLNGPAPVSVQLPDAAPGTYALVRYTTFSGSGAVTTGTLPVGLFGTVRNNSEAKTIELELTGVTPLIWVGDPTNSWDDGVSVNWTYGGTPSVFSAGANVLFDDTAVNSAVILVGALAPGSITVRNSVRDYSIGPDAAGGVITGTSSLIKDGTGRLTLGGANDYTGDVTVQGGILQLASAGALGSSAGGTYVNDGATLNMANVRLANSETIQITGQGYGNIGALYSDAGSGNADYLRDLRLAGDAWVGVTSGARFGFSDVSGTVTCVGGLHKLTKVGLGQFDFEEAAVTVGEIEVAEGILQAANATTINPGSGITIQDGAEFRIYRLAAPLDRPFMLNNGRINVTGSDAPTQNQLDGEITLNANGTFQVGAGFILAANNVVNGSGNLVKTDPGTLTLAAANTYTGNTLINGGTLALAASASIASSPSIFVNAGAVFDVSPAAPWTLAAGQTLSGNGTINGSVNAAGIVAPGASIGSLSFNNDLTLAGTTVMEVTRDGGLASDVLAVAGTLTLGGTLQVVVAGSTPLEVNDTFDLWNAGAVSQTFTSVQLPPGYTWDTASLAVDGTIRVTGTLAAPTLNPPVYTSTDITLSGRGGVPNAAFRVLSSTDIAARLSAWTQAGTGDFDGSGNYRVTLPVSGDDPQRFYVIVSP